ncbi:hypothetical protein QUF58_00250, partial [Anaerolineales bacterium HSG24]|nr:hypothetical protein [Anaerolineales bacterium HSG24]
EKDLTSADGVINTVNYEVGNKGSELSGTWAEYINKTLPKINDRHSKQILLYLSKHNDRKWTPREVKEALQLEISTDIIQQNLQLLVEADLLEQGPADIDYQGLQDGTLNLILRSRFEKEITAFEPDLRQDFQAEIEQLQKEKRSLQGKLNNLVGKMAEYQLATKFRSQKRFALSDDFVGVPDTTRLNIMHVQLRVPLQRANGKRMELDLVAESSDNRWVLVEVKKWQKPVGVNQVDDFQEKVTLYNETHPDKIILPAFLSLGGFTKEAAQHCETHGIGMAEKIKW